MKANASENQGASPRTGKPAKATILKSVKDLVFI